MKGSISLFFRGNSLSLLTGNCSLASSFYLYFSYSVILGKAIVYSCLEGLLYVGTSLFSLYAFKIFGVRPVFSMSICPLIHQCYPLDSGYTDVGWCSFLRFLAAMVTHMMPLEYRMGAKAGCNLSSG